ncbi:MAG: LPS export ABC transporter permease LptG [Gammaproteobacteria bacterium]|nr:LPS export ABC transporter permease LptG [Gammaproteobacteria bacterium]
MIRLDRYIARTLLGAIAMVMAVLAVLGALFLFIGEQNTIGTGRYSTTEALVFALLSVPQFLVNALPAGALIGAMLGIGTLARAHELTVMRSAGMSKWRLLGTVLGSGVLLALVALCVGEYLVPPLTQYASERKAIAKYDNASFAGAGGAWFRDGNTILNVTQQSGDEAFGGTLVFELDAAGRLITAGRAERARATGQQSWELSGYVESRFSGDAVSATRSAGRRLQSAASAGFLQLTVSEPAELSVRVLRRAIGYLRMNQLDVGRYQIALWSRLARLLALPVALAFALPFGFGSMRSAGIGARTTLGLGIGILYFFLQRMVESGAVVFRIDPLLLAGLPTLLLTAAAGVLLVRAR